MPTPSVRSLVPVLPLVLALALASAVPMADSGHLPSVSERSMLLSVIDDDGAPITGLTAEQFVVLEDGALRPVTAARMATEPLAVALTFDVTQPPYGETLNVRDIRDAAAAFIATVHTAQPDASIQLMEFAGASTVRVKFTTDTEELTKSAQRIFQSQQGGGPLMEAISDAARDLRDHDNPRRVIVSVDRDAPDPSRLQPDQLIDAMNESSATLWAISIRALGRGSPGREEMLEYLTSNSGGTYQSARVLTPLKEMLTRVAQVITSQYVITYTRPDGVNVKDVLAGTTGAGTVLVSTMAER